MKLNYENAMRDYADHYGKQLSPECYQIFSTIAMQSFGKWDDDFLVDKKSICEVVSISERSCVTALRDLAACQLIHLTKGKGGRGKKSYYAINIKTVQKLHKLEVVSEYNLKTVQNKQCKINSVKKGTIHGFEKSINISKRSVKESPQETPSALPSASLPAVKQKLSNKQQHKKSSDEHKAFDAVYFIFTDIRGPFEPGINGRQCKAIWELIDKAKVAEPISWINLLEGMVSEFHRIKTSGLKKDKFLADRPFLPSELNSSGIWPRVLDNLRSTESKKPTKEDIRLRDMATAAIKGVI